MRLRRMVAPLLVIAVSGNVGAADAQTTLSAGILGGAVLAKISTPNVDNVFTKSRVGFAAGGFLTVGLSPHFAIEPQALVVQKGGKAEESGGHGSIKISYLEIPLLAKLRLGGTGRVSPHFYAGPAFAYKMDCSVSFSDATTSISGKCGTGPFSDVELKSTDVSVIGGAGIDVGRLMLGVRYDLGLTKFGNSGDAETDNVKTRALYFLGGLSFAIPR